MIGPLVRLVQPCSDQAEQDKLLLMLPKLLSCSLVQRFPGMGPANFKLPGDSEFKLYGQHPQESLNKRTSQRFLVRYQSIGLFAPFCTSPNKLNKPHRLGDPCP